MNTDDFISELAKESKAVKPLLPAVARTALWIGFSLAYFIGLILVLGVRADVMVKFHEGIFVAEILLAGSVGILAAYVACCACLPDMNQQDELRFTPFVLFSILVVLLAVAHVNAETDPMGSLFLQCLTKGYDCTWHILLFSLIPGVILFFMMWRAAAVHAYWAGSMAVLAVTSFGYVAMRFLEANDVVAHILIWHYFPMLFMALLGMLIGKRILRW